ncbi:MAG: L-threonylcarbamoyladenylate synthase [Vicinamibacterales bacterium]
MISARLRIIVSANTPDHELIGRAASLLGLGAIAAVPTDTLYGLAADPFSATAVQRIFSIKDRAQERALPLVASNLQQVESRIGVLTPLARRLAERYWPGPLTLVVPAPATIAAEVIGTHATVGVRVPAHAVTRALCEAFGSPLTATSANISGQPPTNDPDVVWQTIGDRIDVLVDAGCTPGGPPSTIVDVTGAVPGLIRAGAISWDSVLAAIRA